MLARAQLKDVKYAIAVKNFVNLVKNLQIGYIYLTQRPQRFFYNIFFNSLQSLPDPNSTDNSS